MLSHWVPCFISGPLRSVPHPQSGGLSPHVVPMAQHDLVPGCIRGPTLHTLSSVHWVAGRWVCPALCEVPNPRAFALAVLTTWKVFPVISTWLPPPLIPVSAQMSATRRRQYFGLVLRWLNGAGDKRKGFFKGTADRTWVGISNLGKSEKSLPFSVLQIPRL